MADNLIADLQKLFKMANKKKKSSKRLKNFGVWLDEQLHK